jgi:N-acetylmuramoyl-L-alanine amidase
MLTTMASGLRSLFVLALILQAQAPPEVPPPAPLPPPPSITVVIDPGHGGDDRGAVGSSGLEEKLIVLNVAQRVRAIGAERGVRVLLTREDDRQVSLMQRAAFANGAGAAVFISLHANAGPSPVTTGAEVASFAGTTPQAPPLTPAEDRALSVPVVSGGTRRIAAVLWELAQARHAESGAAFAKAVGERLQRVGPLGPRAVYRSPLRPLTAVNLPAVLVDVGYLSNPEEEKLVAGEVRQTALAQALVDAMLAFDPAPKPAPRPVGR